MKGVLSPGGDLDHPGWELGKQIGPKHVYQHSVSAPVGTCDDLLKLGATLNKIHDRHYELPGTGGCNVSNSNSVTSTILKCADVELSPKGDWGTRLGG